MSHIVTSTSKKVLSRTELSHHEAHTDRNLRQRADARYRLYGPGRPRYCTLLDENQELFPFCLSLKEDQKDQRN
jgi:hypothetical protein